MPTNDDRKKSNGRDEDNIRHTEITVPRIKKKPKQQTEITVPRIKKKHKQETEITVPYIKSVSTDKVVFSNSPKKKPLKPKKISPSQRKRRVPVQEKTIKVPTIKKKSKQEIKIPVPLIKIKSKQNVEIKVPIGIANIRDEVNVLNLKESPDKEKEIKLEEDQTSIPQELARKSKFDFKSAQLGRSRKILSYYFFELLNNTELDLYKLILNLENIDRSKIILRLRGVFTGKEKELTQNEAQMVNQLTEREIKQYKEMGTNYLETFIKYLSDLYNIIKLLIISNRSHKIVGADFFCFPFVRFLMNEKNINLFLKEDVLHREIGEIYDYLKGSKYANLFPARRKKVSSGETYWSQSTSSEHSYIIGSRIKIYIMAHIYKGKYFKNGLSVCLDCFMEGKKSNISFPRLRAKSFHHEDDDLRIEKYNSERLSKIFNKNRGNPYFLLDLINQMELESVVLKCRCHHQLLHLDIFYDFKKLISWEDVYCKEFPYKDIFELPAEIIHVLIMVCVDNFYKTRSNTEIEKKRLVENIIISLKKRYFIDLLYGGICPICGEFNTRDHLPIFDFNHLYKKTELTPEERRKRKKIDDLFFLPCSEIVKEMEKKYNKGGFICANEHMVIHETVSNELFDDKAINKLNFKDHKDTTEKFKQNLIHNSKNKDLIKNPLKLEGSKRRPLTKFLMAVFQIWEEKGVVITSDLMNTTGLSKSAIGYLFNAKRELLIKYGELIIGKGHTPTKYYLNDDGIRIMRLIYYFRDFYRNLKPEE